MAPPINCNYDHAKIWPHGIALVALLRFSNKLNQYFLHRKGLKNRVLTFLRDISCFWMIFGVMITLSLMLHTVTVTLYLQYDNCVCLKLNEDISLDKKQCLPSIKSIMQN